MSYPSSGSIMSGQVNAGMSPQILVKVFNTTVGAIQSINVTQDRGMTVVEEIGNDGVIEIHPKGAAQISLSINRLVFDNLRLPEALGRGFVNIQSQRIPFDICILDRSTIKPESGTAERIVNGFLGAIGQGDHNLKTGDVTKALNWATNKLSGLNVGIQEVEPYIGHIVHTYNNCWIKQYTTKYEAENYLILETANIVCEYATSNVDSRNVATGGLRGIQYDYDSIERTTDLTGNRGKFYAVVDNRGFGTKLLDAIF